jgi:hypothetical protein
MATVNINKAVIFSDYFCIQQAVSGAVGATTLHNLQLPDGIPLRLADVSVVMTAAGAAFNTQVLLLNKISADGLTTTTICTWAGSDLNNKAADVVVAKPAFDVAESDIEDGGSLQFSMTWGAADTAAVQVTCFLTRR